MTVPATPDSPETAAESVVEPIASPTAEQPAAADTASDAPAAPATPQRTIPDRADAPVSEVTERFLRAIVADVPLTRIEELHLFSPLRQGTVETGIAVFAATAPVAVAPEHALELALDDESDRDTEVLDADASDTDVIVITEQVVTDVVAADGNEVDAELVETEIVDTDETNATESATDASNDVDVPAEAEIIDVDVVDVVSAELEGAAISDIITDIDDADVTIEPAVDITEAVVAASIARHTVYTARYRLVIKGPERGRWEASVVAEADAPLITVETVVRGVQRRAGEDTEIVRYTGAQIAKALRVPFA